MRWGVRLGSEPGARASRPHKSSRGLVRLRHLARLATAPALRFSRAHAVPASRVAGWGIAGKLSGTQRSSMRAGRPRSRVGILPSLLLLNGKRAGLPGRSPADAAEPSGLVALRGLRVTSWITPFSLVSGKTCVLQSDGIGAAPVLGLSRSRVWASGRYRRDGALLPGRDCTLC